jgi:hypothetical protein
MSEPEFAKHLRELREGKSKPAPRALALSGQEAVALTVENVSALRPSADIFCGPGAEKILSPWKAGPSGEHVFILPRDLLVRMKPFSPHSIIRWAVPRPEAAEGVDVVSDAGEFFWLDAHALLDLHRHPDSLDVLLGSVAPLRSAPLFGIGGLEHKLFGSPKFALPLVLFEAEETAMRKRAQAIWKLRAGGDLAVAAPQRADDPNRVTLHFTTPMGRLQVEAVL